MPKDIYAGALLDQFYTTPRGQVTAPRAKDRTELDALVAAYLAQGGRITRCKGRATGR